MRTRLVLLGGGVLRLALVLTPSSYSGDVWRQSDTAEIARQLSRHDLNLFMPRIAWGGNGPGFVETELPLQPWLSALAYRVVGEHPTIGRLISAAFSIATLALVASLARRTLPPRAALLTIVAMAALPLGLRYSAAFMPEPTTLFFAVLGWWAWQRWIDGERRRDLVVSAAAIAMALLCKPTAGLVPLWLLTSLVLGDRGRIRRRWRALLVAGVASLLPYAAWATWSHRLYVDYGNTFGTGYGGDPKWAGPSTWLRPGFWLHSATWDVEHLLGVGLVVPALVGLVVCVRRRQQPVVVAALLWWVPYAIATSRYAGFDRGPQYQIWLVVPLAMLVGTGADAMLSAGRRAVGLLVVATATSAVVTGGLFAGMLTTDYASTVTACAAAVDRVAPAGTLIAVVSSDVASDDGTVNNFEEPTLFYLADRTGFPIGLDQRTAASVERVRRGGATLLVDDQPGPPPPGLVPMAGTPTGCLIARL